MLTERQLFYQHLANPSSKPLALEIERADGIFIYDTDGKSYYDLVSGVSVSNLGHLYPDVVKAVKCQLDKYMHLMVYGKYIQSPQVRLAQKLSAVLPASLDSTYLVNSGSEAIEGAMKLAKRLTSRSGFIAFHRAYHGGTQGALSILGNEEMKSAFHPLLPEVTFIHFNEMADLEYIDNETAAVIIEPVQTEAGVMIPDQDYMLKLRDRCNEVGTLLIFDEIQMAFGRSGKLFCFEHFNVVPDILCLAKAMGGGMPIGAFISSKDNMSKLTYKPELGHITTFGGHPVSAAAALANLEVLTNKAFIQQTEEKGKFFTKLLGEHKHIKEIRQIGLMLGVELKDPSLLASLLKLFVENGIVVDQFLFNGSSFRIAPPLIITKEQIDDICRIINNCLDQL